MPPSTSLDVQSKKFTRAMRGYAIDEVDAFLDQVGEELTRLRKDSTRPPGMPIDRADEEAIARALVTAQRVAEQTLEDAKVEAQAIMVEAQAAATETTETAQLQAREIVEAAELHARQVKEQLGQRRRELEQSIQALQAFEGDYRGRLRSCVEELMHTLEDSAPTGPVAPPAPPGLLSASS
jgi:cell division initiation protein